MQTIYTTSYRLGVREKVVDLNAYRRLLEQPEEEPREDLEVSPLLWEREDRPGQRPPLRRAARFGAWALDICASAGVLAMTLAFTVHIL